MAYTIDDLIQRVSSKIDEVVPKGDNVEAGALSEAPVNFIEEEMDRSAEFILRMGPVTMVKQAMVKAAKHFPVAPTAFNGLTNVGGTNVTNNNLVSINSVSYNINGVPYGLNPMPVTIASNPAAGLNRRDIIVGNDENELEYIAGSANANPDLLDFPNVPVGKVLVMKVIILDDGAGGFTKTYIGGQTFGLASNPNVRLIYNDNTGISLVPCPTDFLRFISIELSNWSMPVMELLKQEDPKYRIQKNNRDHRGTALKPKAALVGFTDYLPSEINASYPNRNVAIECFSSKTAPTLTAFHYIPKTSAINLPEDLIDPMLWMCAARALRIMRQFPAAEAAKGVVEEYFGYKFGFYSEEK